MTLSAEGIDGSTEEKAASVCMVGHQVGVQGSRLHIPVPAQAASKSQMEQGTFDLWVGEQTWEGGISGENPTRYAPSIPWVKLNSPMLLFIACCTVCQGTDWPPCQLISKYNSYQSLKMESRPIDLCQQKLKSQMGQAGMNLNLQGEGLNYILGKNSLL